MTGQPTLAVALVSAAILLVGCDEPPKLAPQSPQVVPEREASGAEEPRFVPGDPPIRMPVQMGFVDDGIYVLPGDPETIVLLKHDGGALHLLRPSSNTQNRWNFELPGERLESSDPRLTSIIKVPYEGYYRLTRELLFADGGRWLTGAIVQLGYDRAGGPIVFIAQRRHESQNVLFFSDKGVKIRRDELQWLEPLAWYEEASEQ